MKRQHRAIVERYRPLTIGDIRTRERARLPCGCALYVGRSASGEAATRAQACSERHAALVERANVLLTESLAYPTSRELVSVCRDMLGQAAKELT